jgi:hypothetical protein
MKRDKKEWNQIHQGAELGKSALNAAAGFNPICNGLTVVGGQDCAFRSI